MFAFGLAAIRRREAWRAHGLGLVLLALLLQIVLPIAHARAMALAGGTTADIIHCLTGKAAPSNDGPAPTTTPRAAADCTLCHAFGGAPAALPAPPIVLAQPDIVRPALVAPADPAVAPLHRRGPGQPRAPPA